MTDKPVNGDGSRRGFERVDVDGIPAFVGEVPGPCRGALAFRTGRADETLATGGITHLVEHLAMYAVGPRDFAVNGFVDETRTVFYAEGNRDEVSAFLAEVAGALSSLPLERLDIEKRVLRTEAAGDASSFLGRLLAHRFGSATYGLPNYMELGLSWLGAEEIEQWARRFARENAALWMTRPLPEGFRIDLPLGRRTPPPEPRAVRDLEPPVHVDEGTGGVGASFLAERSVALTMALAIAGDRSHRELRLEQGLVYGTGGTYVPLTAELTHVTFGADCLDENAAEVRDGLLSILDDLATDGPSEAELEREVGLARRALEDPDSRTASLDAHARDELLGAPILGEDELMRERCEVDRRTAATAMERALQSMILVVPEGVAPPPGRFPVAEPPTRERLPGRALELRPNRTALRERGVETIVGPEGVTHVPGRDADPVTVPFAECAAVFREVFGALFVRSRDGDWVRLNPFDYLGLDEAVAEIERRVASELFVPLEDRSAQVERVAETLTAPWTLDDELFMLADVLAEDERLVDMIGAGHEKAQGLLAVTSSRTLFLHNRKENRSSEHPHEQTRSVKRRGGFLPERLTLETADGKVVFTSFSPERRFPEFAAAVEELATAS